MMNLIPRSSMFGFFDDWPDLWGQAGGMTRSGDSFIPRVDIKDKKDHYEITAELPGVSKDDVHITLENGVLTIEAECKQEDKEEKDGKVIRQERRYGKFMRSFTVGGEIEQDKIKASFKDGVLSLTTPKAKTPESVARKIAVN